MTTARKDAVVGNPRQVVELERRIDGQLWARTGGREVRVQVHRCFPWSAPGRFVSLRDAEKEEVALVRGRGRTRREIAHGPRGCARPGRFRAGGDAHQRRGGGSRDPGPAGRDPPGTPLLPDKARRLAARSVEFGLPDPRRFRRSLPCARRGRAGQREPEMVVGVRGVRGAGFQERGRRSGSSGDTNRGLPIGWPCGGDSRNVTLS